MEAMTRTESDYDPEDQLELGSRLRMLGRTWIVKERNYRSDGGEGDFATVQLVPEERNTARNTQVRINSADLSFVGCTISSKAWKP